MGTKSGERGAQQDLIENRRNWAAQTIANQPNQYGPQGSTEWTFELATDPTTGEQYMQPVQRNTLSEAGQRIYGAQQGLFGDQAQAARGMFGRVTDAYGTPFDMSGFQGYGDVPQSGDMGRLPQQGMMGALPVARQYAPENIQRQVDTSGAQQRGNVEDVRNRAEQAIWERATSRLDPQWQQRMGDSRASLVAQGLRPGDAAYNRERANLNRSRTDAYQTAMNEAIMGGGQEAARQYNMQLQGRQQDLGEAFTQGNFYNKAADQALRQQLGIGQQGFNEALNIATMDQSRQGQDFNQQNAIAAAEQSRQNQMFQQGLVGAQYANQLRQQQIQEGLLARNLPLSEFQGVQQGVPVVNPSFGRVGGVGQLPQSTLMQGKMADQADSTSQSNSLWGAFGGLGSSAVMGYGLYAGGGGGGGGGFLGGSGGNGALMGGSGALNNLGFQSGVY